ncbi:MAG: hypothetical protein DRO13_05900 [Thermoprotei archaeon]|nr:MAG: hypothetical protein DRO13_05900 [Thermoprotei archaeon]
MWRTGIRRAKRGKTLKIDIKLEGDHVREVVISGDFSAYPEEAIDRLESALRDKRVAEIPHILRKFREEVELVGITYDDLVELILELVRR